ncbi:MAG: GldG family protein [Elusimicrobiota bacterium]
MTERAKKLAFSWTGTALVAAILAALNVVCHFAYGRLDFSAGRIYSISLGTTAILNQVKDDLVVKVYYSPHLPPPYGPNGAYLKDLLGEYKSASHGHMRLEFVDPDKNDAIKRQAEEAGVTPVQINVLSQDQFEVKEIFMGVVFLYQGKTAVIPIVQDVSNLEYDLSQRINKLTQTRMKTVGIVAGHGEKNPADPDMAKIFEPLRDEMNIESLSLDKPVDPKFDALWILGPRQPYKPAEIDRLKAWVDSGRTLGILLDRSNIDLRSFQSAPISTGLDALLLQWGARVRRGFIADAQAEKIQMQAQIGMFLLPIIRSYPFIPAVNTINPDSPITRGLNILTFPFVHPVIYKAPEGSDLHYTSLADSSDSSWYESTNLISPNQQISTLQNNAKGPFSLAGVITGNFSKAAPSQAPAASGHVAIVGTSYQLDPELADKASNRAFFANLLDWSLQNRNLLSIRAKSVSYRPLRTFSTPAREALKYFLIFFPTILLIFAGAFIYRRQSIRLKFLPLAYADLES